MPVDTRNPRNETERRIARLEATQLEVARTVAQSRRLVAESRRLMGAPPGEPGKS